MKKNVTIFIMLGLVGLVCSQLEGLKRKEFAKLRQLEKQLGTRIKAGIQGDPQAWFDNSIKILAEIEQLDPQSSIPFVKKLKVLSDVEEAKVEQAEEAQAWKKVEELEEKLGYITEEIKQAEDAFVYLKDLSDELENFIIQVDGVKDMIFEKDYNYFIEKHKSLLKKLHYIIVRDAENIEKEIPLIDQEIEESKQSPQQANFERIRKNIQEQQDNLIYLSGAISDNEYNKLEQRLNELDEKLSQAELDAVEKIGQKAVQIKKELIEEIKEISGPIAELSEKIDDIQMQVTSYEGEEEFLFEGYLDEVNEIRFDIDQQKNMLTQQDFDSLQKELKKLKITLANAVYKNAANIIKHLLGNQIKSLSDDIKGEVKKDKKLDTQKIKTTIKEIETYLIVASQDGLLKSIEDNASSSSKGDLNGVLTMLGNYIINPTVEIEGKESLFELVSAATKLRIDKITEEEIEGKLDLDLFGIIASNVIVMNELDNLYSKLPQWFSLDAKLIENTVKGMKTITSKSKVDLYNLYQVEDAGGGKITVAYNKKGIVAGLVEALLWEAEKERTGTVKDPLSDIPPTVQEIIAGRREE